MHYLKRTKNNGKHPSIPGQACIDYTGRYYKINQTWVSKFGRLKCTPSGVEYEIGM